MRTPRRRPPPGHAEACGTTYILSNMSPGGMEHEKVVKSMELLAQKVWPKLL